MNATSRGTWRRRVILGAGILGVALVAALALRHLQYSPSETEPFSMGAATVLGPGEAPEPASVAAPRVEIISPRRGQSFRKGQEIDYLVQMTVPAGGKMPSFINTALQKNRVAYDTGAPVPKAKSDEGRYLFEGRFKGQSKTGKYEIAAWATDTTIIRPKIEGEEVKFKDFRYNAEPVEVVIMP